MDIVKETLNRVYKYGSLGYFIYKVFYQLSVLKYNLGTDVYVTKRKYKAIHGKKIDLKKPRTLNEKIIWLKLFDHKPIHTLLADKYTVRKYIAEKFGEKYLIPLVFNTTNWKEIELDVIPNYPCIIKASHTSGDYQIIKDKSKVNIKKLRFMCRAWLGRNYYFNSQEWQYKNSTRRIIIEKLLTTKDGYIPNDYKLHYFNGNLEFVYCSVGRETVNKRNIYDANWNPLYFSWVEHYKNTSDIRGEEIEAPKSFEEMKRIGSEIAKEFKYVRVDFYDVDGKLYIGEITFHHGGGFDIFTPDSYDLYYGEKLNIK